MQRYGNRVAVIGAGPGGLAAARFLAAHGFEPVIYETAERLGGQWNAGSEKSGVWPGMRTNTSRVTTRFSDLDYPPTVGPFPANDEVLAYLTDYAERFGLAERIRLGTQVETLARHPAGGWVVHSRRDGSPPRTELFYRVVVASGRYTKPSQPQIRGMDRFAGSGGVLHSFDYDGPERFAGKSVVVAGCSISALEIASELAYAGATHVVSTMRRQRYVIKKVIGGVPADNVGMTRFGALAAECLPSDVLAAELKKLIIQTSGDPAVCGCPTSADSILEAGISLSQDWLDLVKAGRIAAKPWLEELEGRTARFADGSSAGADALILATGFDLDLPFLDLKTRSALGLGREGGSLNLYDMTFHPDLEGLAFVGMYSLTGPYFPAVELQARWIAYAWAGLTKMPQPGAMRAGLASLSGRPDGAAPVFSHAVGLRFARNAGVEPRLADWPGLARALLFGPLTPVSFRLSGPDAMKGASWEVMTEAARCGAVATPTFNEAEIRKLESLVANGRGDLAGLLPGNSTAASRIAA